MARPVDQFTRLVLVEERHLLSGDGTKEGVPEAGGDALRNDSHQVNPAEVGGGANGKHPNKNPANVFQVVLDRSLGR